MKLNYRRTFFIGLAFLSISGFWQMYDNIIPLILQNTFNIGETVTGVIMAMDNVLALFLLPILGSISDRVDTRLGKRTPFILTGTTLAVIFLILLPIADRRVSLVMFIICLFGTLLSMGLYRSPAVALMPDLTPNSLRSKANAIINLMGAVGAVYVLLMIRLLVGNQKKPDYMPLFLSVAILMVVAVGVLMLTINEKKVHAKAVQEYGEKEMQVEKTEEKETVKVPMAKDVKKSLIFLLLSVFLWFTAYNAVTTALSRFAFKMWGEKGGMYSSCLMCATVVAILSYIPIGMISSKIGRKRTILSGIVLMTVCYLSACFATSYQLWVYIPFALIGVGWAAINVNSYPMVVAMSKGADIGKYTGLYYTFSMAAQIFTPILSGALLENVSYYTLFPYAVLFSVGSFLTMLMVKHGDSKAEKKASLLEHFDVDD